MTSQEVVQDPALYEDLVLTVPFYHESAECECSPMDQVEEPFGCKGCCAPVNALAKLKSEALEQTAKRWAWFSEARRLDEELSTRLGTLGYLPWEIRVEIFRHVLDSHIEEALNDKRWALFFSLKLSHFAPKEEFSLPWDWNARTDEFSTVFYIEVCSGHKFSFPGLYGVCRAFPHPPTMNEKPSSFFIPLRLATADIMLEFDNVFFSKMTLRFSCPKILRQFLKELSATQLSQMRSITIVPFECRDCCFECLNWDPNCWIPALHKNWTSVCSQLPSTLGLIIFELDYSQSERLSPSCANSSRSSALDRRYRDNSMKCTKALLESLSRQIRHIALEAEIALADRPAWAGEEWYELDAAFRETEKWSKDYIEWMKGSNGTE